MKATKASLYLAHATWRRRRSMTALLVSLVLMIFVVPLVTPPLGERGRTLIEVFFILVLLCGAWTIAEHRKVAISLSTLCAVALVMAWAIPLHGNHSGSLARQGAALLGLVILTAAVAARVFHPGRIAADRVMGAIALYLILGIVWGNAYEIVALLDAGAFSQSSDPVRGMERWFYFSFVTLTTLGYGDVTPVSRAARALATGEAMVGQLYPAIILARLVTLVATDSDKRDAGR